MIIAMSPHSETDRTEIVSVHNRRRVARAKERALTAKLRLGLISSDERWIQGYRVRDAGGEQFVVEATSWRGH
jgi:hypothetical protein